MVKAWSAVVSLGLALSIAVGCGDDEDDGGGAPPTRGGLDAPCSTTEQCEDGLICPRGGESKGVCSVECEDDQDCKLHAGDTYSCLEGVCALCDDACGLGGASNASGGSSNAGSGGSAGEVAIGEGGAGSAGEAGAPATAGAGGGGGSEEYECPENASATKDNPLIDDFEDGDLFAAQLDGRNGEWSAQWGGDPLPLVVKTPGEGDTDHSLVVSGWFEPEVDERSLLLPFVKRAASGHCLYDISAFKGLRFTVSVGPQNQGFRVQLTTTRACLSYSCDHEFGAWIFDPVLEETEIELPWTEFEQREPDDSVLDLTQIVGLRFLFSPDGYAFHNVEFY